MQEQKTDTVSENMDDDGNGKLFKAVEKSYRDWDSFRRVNKSLVEEYAGDGYGASSSNEGRKRELVVNLLHQTVSAYMMSLAANRPKVLVSTRRRNLRGFARHYQLALNNLIEEIGLVHTIRRWVLDSFFSIGVVKAHMSDSAVVELERDVYADPGRPFASNVSLDNFVADTSAKKWSEAEFVGDVYRIPYEDLEDDTIWDQEAVKLVRPGSKMEVSEDRLENIGKGYETDADEFRPMVDLVDLWLPREGKVVTYPCDFRNGSLKPYGKPLAEMEWTGSDLGPYHILSFDDVPENLMPVGPATHLSPLARHINNVYRKQVRSARDFKEVQTYTAGAEKSARNLQAAKHGELVCINDPNEIASIKLGGVDQQNQMFMLNMIDHFDNLAGNLSALAGLGPQADTLGQERLIHGAMSGRVAQMASRVTDAVVLLVRDLGRMLWDDDVNSIPGELQWEGLDGVFADSPWKPGDREGQHSDYDISIDVYSMSYKSPSERAKAILELVTNVYVPLGQMLMMQGGTIDMRQLNDTLAELMDLPRLKDVIRFNAPAAAAGGEMQGMGGGPSTREYVRRSAGNNAHGRNVSQQQAWAAASSSGGGEQ